MDNNQLLSRLLDSQQGMANDINEIKILLAKQEESLRYHIKRTDLAEDNMALLRDELKPIKNHVALVNAVLRIFGAFAAIVSVGAGLIKVVQFFTN